MSLAALSPSDRQALRRRLLAWFARSRRDLPWRANSDPYRVWLSEIMLQQTRVAVVVPYYLRFLKQFPDVAALAGADGERVLRAWAGLGYYSRARNLQRAAKEIVNHHQGIFPREHAAALALPGIGSYTAAAVLSIAYSQPLAVLDGNVARVIARLDAERRELRAPAVWRSLEASAQNLLARSRPGDWNQSMMELGATVCVPKSPLCGECPVSQWCAARRLGLTGEIPAKRRKRAPVALAFAALVFVDDAGRTFLEKPSGDKGALFSRMWQFPAVEIAPAASGKWARAGVASLAAFARRRFGIVINRKEMIPLPLKRHAVTFRRMILVPYLLRVRELPQADGVQTVLLSRMETITISNATRKIAGSANAHLAAHPGSPRALAAVTA